MPRRAKKWQMLKREREKLGRMVIAWFKKHGQLSKKIDPDLYYYTVDTQVGALRLRFDEGYGTIFGKFLEPRRALQRVNCNPYSGKWSFHFGRVTADAAFEWFTSEVEPLLLKEK